MESPENSPSPGQARALAAIDMLLETLGILNSALEKEDDDKAHEAVTVLLMQFMTTYGPGHPLMEEFFPVMDGIQQRIDAMELVAALEQARELESQLSEFRRIIGRRA